MASTKFYGAQLGGKTVINYSYTDSPLRLLRWDIFYFFKFAWAWLYIVWPFTPTDSGALDELALTLPNVWAMFVHAVLFVLQLAFLLSIPFALVLPAYLTGLAMAIFFTFNWLLCMLLNGSGVEYTSDPKYTPDAEAYANEQWVFLNGVAVGGWWAAGSEHWMKGNLNRLALTFKRPVLGIHNRTSGIIFDVIECLIQRNFGYATNDIRVCYKIVKEKLYNPQFSKVVFILHSQGGIEGGMVCDWLLQELPQDLLAKLEVYTFGCASNHFNNPHRHVNWQHQALSHPVQASADTAAPPAPSTTPKKGAGRTNGASKNDRRTSAQAQANGTDCRAQALRLLTETSSLHPTDTSGLAIGHIEHYAHTTDFVAVWGILHFATTARSSHMLPRFKGRVFARTSPRGGHQLCQHYLDGMFPLERNPKTGEFLGAAEKGNEFMESDIVLGRDGDESADIREAYQGSWIGEALAETPDDVAAADSTVKIHGGTPVASRSGTRRVKVKDLSRLWLYRNGRVPDEKPPLLHQEPDGVVRGATL